MLVGFDVLGSLSVGSLLSIVIVTVTLRGVDLDLALFVSFGEQLAGVVLHEMLPLLVVDLQDDVLIGEHRQFHSLLEESSFALQIGDPSGGVTGYFLRGFNSSLAH